VTEQTPVPASPSRPLIALPAQVLPGQIRPDQVLPGQVLPDLAARALARPGPGRLRRRSRRSPRHPAVALLGVIGFGLLAAFFAWQAAEPLWLAVGVGADGTAAATRCDAATGTEATDRTRPAASYPCLVFDAADGSYRAVDVTLRGAGDPGQTPVPARMISPDSHRAYATSPAGLHLRWSVGLALVLACGAGIAWVTGARRFAPRTARRRAVLLCFAGPLLLTAGFLTAAL
jgi:hypothetical protein